MPLSDADFRSIMSEYEETRARNSLLLEKRKREVIKKVPEYAALDDEAAMISLDLGKKSISGDDSALLSLDKALNEIKKKRSALLKASGFARDFLDPVFDCPECADTGFVNGKRCHCLKQKIINALYLQSHIMDSLKENNFESCDLSLFSDETRIEMEKVYGAAKEFIRGFPDNGRSLLFLGNVGSGKTFLADCIAKALLDRGFSVVYFSAFRLFEFLADTIFRNEDISERDMRYSNIYDSDLLIIDDLGTENTNSFVAAQLFNILNERKLRKRSTIISSNLSLEKIKDIYSERSLSRIIGNFELFFFRSDDLRLGRTGKD